MANKLKGLKASMINYQGQLRYLFASSLLISFLLPNSAAFAATYNWQGPYVGGFLGAGVATNHVSTDAGSVTGNSYFPTGADISAVNNAGSSTNNPSSLIAGLQAGHDWVWNQIVYGVVADYSLLPFSSSDGVNNKNYPDNSNQFSVFTSMSTNWLFTLRGRVGYDVDSMLHWPSFLYVTGGMAMTQLRVNNNFSDNSSLAGAGGTSTTQNQIGWTAGAGIELAAMGHTSIDVEYLYVHIPSLTTTSSISNSAGGFGVPPQSLNNTFSTNGDFHANVIKVGLNYRFDE